MAATTDSLAGWQPWDAYVKSAPWRDRQNRGGLLYNMQTSPEVVAYLEAALPVEPDDDAGTTLALALARHQMGANADPVDVLVAALALVRPQWGSKVVESARALGASLNDPNALTAALKTADSSTHQILWPLVAQAGFAPVLAALEDWLAKRPGNVHPSAFSSLAEAFKREPPIPPTTSYRLRARPADRAESVRLAILCRMDALSAEAHAAALAMLSSDPFYGSEVDAQIVRDSRHEHPGVRTTAVAAIQRLASAGAAHARGLLAAESDPSVLREVVSRSRAVGIPDDEIVRALGENPVSSVAAQGVLSLARHTSEWISLLRRLWPSLPAGLRSALEAQPYYWGHPFHRHHMEEWDWLAERMVRRLGGLPPPLVSLAMSYVTRPLPEVIGAYDFESVTGLRRRAPVRIRTSPLLRFGYLVTASTRSGEPLTRALEWRRGLEGLVALEQQFDDARDELASVRSEFDALAAELGPQVADAVLRQEGPEGVSGLRGRMAEAASRYKELEWRYRALVGQVEIEGDGSRFYELRAATHQMLPRLLEVGCNFGGLAAPDGVFGEYSPTDRYITLFEPMIDLAAAEVQRQLGSTAQNVPALLRTIIEIHEFAHAHIHLGEDASGRAWQSPGAATRAYHEALAQHYTRRVVRATNEPGLATVLGVLEEWLPVEYRLADFLDRIEPEEIRAYLVRRREAAPRRTLAEVLDTIAAGLPGYLLLLQPLLPAPSWNRLRDATMERIDRLEATLLDPVRMPDAVELFIAQVGELPQAAGALGAFVQGGWPDAEELRWLIFQAMVAGDAVGEKPLRFFRPEVVAAAVVRSQSTLDALRPTLRTTRRRLARLPPLDMEPAETSR